jgi:ankyrin repeat protein
MLVGGKIPNYSKTISNKGRTIIDRITKAERTLIEKNVFTSELWETCFEPWKKENIIVVNDNYIVYDKRKDNDYKVYTINLSLKKESKIKSKKKSKKKDFNFDLQEIPNENKYIEKSNTYLGGISNDILNDIINSSVLQTCEFIYGFTNNNGLLENTVKFIKIFYKKNRLAQNTNLNPINKYIHNIHYTPLLYAFIYSNNYNVFLDYNLKNIEISNIDDILPLYNYFLCYYNFNSYNSNKSPDLIDAVFNREYDAIEKELLERIATFKKIITDAIIEVGDTFVNKFLIQYFIFILEKTQHLYPINKRQLYTKLFLIESTKESTKEVNLEFNTRHIINFNWNTINSNGNKYPNCGETTILNFFNFVFFDKSAQDINYLKLIHDCPLKNFYDSVIDSDCNNKINNMQNVEILNKWSLLVEKNINFKDVTYHQEYFNIKTIYKNLHPVILWFLGENIIPTNISDDIKFICSQLSNHDIKIDGLENINENNITLKLNNMSIQYNTEHAEMIDTSSNKKFDIIDNINMEYILKYIYPDSNLLKNVVMVHCRHSYIISDLTVSNIYSTIFPVISTNTNDRINKVILSLFTNTKVSLFELNEEDIDNLINIILILYDKKIIKKEITFKLIDTLVKRLKTAVKYIQGSLENIYIKDKGIFNLLLGLEYIQDNKIDSFLCLIVRKNDIDTLNKMIIKNKFNFNFSIYSYDSCLIQAIKNNNIQIAKILIDNGANINYKVNRIHPAYYIKSIEMLKLLNYGSLEGEEVYMGPAIEDAIKNHNQDEDNKIPLLQGIIAISSNKKNDLTTIKRASIREKKEDILDIIDSREITCSDLNDAIQYGHTNIVKKIINKISNILPYNYTPLSRLIISNNIELIKILVNTDKYFWTEILRLGYDNENIVDLLSNSEIKDTIPIDIHIYAIINNRQDILQITSEELIMNDSNVSYFRAAINKEFDNAFLKEDIEKLNFLIKYVDTNFIDFKQDTKIWNNLLYHTKKKDIYVDMANILLESNFTNITINESNLESVIKQNNIKMLELLLSNNSGIIKDYPHLLIFACSKDNKDNIDMVKLLIDYGFDININYKQTSPLLNAIENKNIDIVELLLEKGADVNNIPSTYSPLLYAASLGNRIEICKLLIDNNADVNYTHNGISSLHYALSDALSYNNNSIVELLIDKGVKIDKIKNAIHLPRACLNNSNYIIKLLLDGGCDINTIDYHGRTSLMYSLKNNNMEIINLLLEKGADVNITDKYSKSSLIYAIINGNNNIVEILLKKGAIVNITDKEGKSPLIHAIINGNNNIVEILLEEKADVNISDKQKNTPLWYTFDFINPNIFKLLLMYGADVNIKDKDENAILLTICDNNMDDYFNLFVEYGQNVNYNIVATYKEIPTIPLIYAIRNNNENMIKILLDKFFDAFNKNDNNLVKQLLTKLDNNECNIIFEACLSNNINLIDIIVKKGGNINITSHNKKTPFMIACYYNNIEMCKKLLKYGADTMNSLHNLCRHNNIEIINLILNKIPDINMQNEDGDTPLHIACKYNCNSVIEFLCKNKSDVNIKNNLNDSPLHILCKNNNKDMIALILPLYVSSEKNIYGYRPYELTEDTSIKEMLKDPYYLKYLKYKNKYIQLKKLKIINF